MSEHSDDMDDVERIARDALHARADQIEPSPDAYARLADKVAGAARHPAPWWQSPRLLWLGAAGATAAVIALALVVTFTGDDNSELATATSTPVAEPTLGPVGSPTPGPTPEPGVRTSDVLWPFSAEGPWPATAEEAAATFYRDLVATDSDPTLREVGGTPGSSDREFLVLPTGPDAPSDPAPEQAVATIVTTEVSPGQWGVSAVVSGFVTLEVDTVHADGSLLLTGETFGVDAPPSIVVLDREIGFLADAEGSPLQAARDLYVANIPGESLTGAMDRVLAIAAVEPFGSESPAITVIEIDRTIVNHQTPTVTPTPVGGGADRNQGRPDGVVWPVEAIQPFGEWPTTPEDAAQQFVQQLGGWTLPVGEVTFLEPILMIADVQLQFTDESGEPFGTSTTVRVVGGFDDQGVANWGAVWAISDFIEIDRSFFDGNEFLVSGAGLAFEGVIETQLVDPSGNVAGQGFVTGGGVEMAPIEGTVTLTQNWPGPGFALLYDLGGLGVTPSSLTIVPVVLPEIDQPDPGAGSCSAEGLEPPTPDPDLPEAVEATRQAIATAAIACDWEALGALIDPTQFSFSFGADTDAIDFWEELEGDQLGEPMRFLVETLKLNWVLDELPVEAELPDNYIWPDAFPLIWEDVTPEMRDALRPLYDDQDFEGFANIGGFAGYRLAIDEDGVWRYFIAGD